MPLTLPEKAGWEVPALDTNTKSHYCVWRMRLWIMMGFCVRESKCIQRNYRDFIKALGHLHEILMDFLFSETPSFFNIFLSRAKFEHSSLWILKCCAVPSYFFSQLEEQLSRVQREKNDLQSRMEEDQEDMNELMKKHKAAVAQVTSRFSYFKRGKTASFSTAFIAFPTLKAVHAQLDTLPPVSSFSETALYNDTGSQCQNPYRVQNYFYVMLFCESLL